MYYCTKQRPTKCWLHPFLVRRWIWSPLFFTGSLQYPFEKARSVSQLTRVIFPRWNSSLKCTKEHLWLLYPPQVAFEPTLQKFTYLLRTVPKLPHRNWRPLQDLRRVHRIKPGIHPGHKKPSFAHPCTRNTEKGERKPVKGHVFGFLPLASFICKKSGLPV